MTDWDRLKANYNSEFLQHSSEHGSDGELYEPEPSQEDEMLRTMLRREERDTRTTYAASESPPRRTARPSTHQEITSMHGNSNSTFSNAQLIILAVPVSPPCTISPKVEQIQEIDFKPHPAALETSETSINKCLQARVRELEANLEVERGDFRTRLEKLAEDRNRYREQARTSDFLQKSCGLVEDLTRPNKIASHSQSAARPQDCKVRKQACCGKNVRVHRPRQTWRDSGGDDEGVNERKRSKETLPSIERSLSG
ncbi:hypothetical protein K438DRAFT_1782118 [Mycena galopus ATCC 62051]|nr:hypothetical protein K438DRAFT_1782118 [Mycena galopus ATCC 62051]